MYVCMYICKYVYVCVYVCTYVNMCVCKICVYVCIIFPLFCYRESSLSSIRGVIKMSEGSDDFGGLPSPSSAVTNQVSKEQV